MLDPNPSITNVGVEPLSFSLVCEAAALPWQWGRNGAEMCAQTPALVKTLEEILENKCSCVFCFFCFFFGFSPGVKGPTRRSRLY